MNDAEKDLKLSEQQTQSIKDFKNLLADYSLELFKIEDTRQDYRTFRAVHETIRQIENLCDALLNFKGENNE